jgi:hypothetical protein
MNNKKSLSFYRCNYNYDNKYKENRMSHFYETGKTTSTKVSDYITCYNKFRRIQTDLNIIDILQLFE